MFHAFGNRYFNPFRFGMYGLNSIITLITCIHSELHLNIFLDWIGILWMNCVLTHKYIVLIHLIFTLLYNLYILSD